MDPSSTPLEARIPVVKLTSLSYTYAGAASPALDGVSLEVYEADYLAIVGANGSGKSTLVRCLNGLLEPPPGTVSVDGADPAGLTGRVAARKALALVFQSPVDQIVASVVEEDVAFGLENLGVPRPEMCSRVEAALEAVELIEERSRPPRFLSAGQQQRLAVAGAIAMRPRVVAFDEATSMIDPAGRDAVLDLMDGLVAGGTAVIHVTHDMDEAARARRVAVLSGGRLVFLGTPAELFASGDIAAYSLARPRSWEAALALGLEPIVGEGAEALGRRAAGAGLSPAILAEPSGFSAATPAAAEPSGVSVPASIPAELSGFSAATPAAAEPDARQKNIAFSLRDVSMSYLAGTESERLAVDRVSLELPRGSLLALVGRTGSGKSSLLQLLDGLALPDSGSVTSLGVDTADPGANLRAVRMRSPLAVQQAESAFFETYVGDEVAFGPRTQGLTGQALVDRVRAAMEAAGLPFDEYRDRRTRSLSGGRKRRLALATILALAPDALLLDEPCAALDPASRAEILALIHHYTASGGPGRRTVVMSTHSMEEAGEADFVAVMKSGAVVAFGPPASVFGEAWDPAWGIERPFSYRLREAMCADTACADTACAGTAFTEAACADTACADTACADTACADARRAGEPRAGEPAAGFQRQPA